MIGNPIKRRGVIGLLIGAASAAKAPPVITSRAAAAALGVSTALDASPTDVAEAGIGVRSLDDVDWHFINTVENQLYYKNRPIAEMPPHISSKKSWSPVFKASVHAKEQAVIRAYIDKLRRDRSFMERVVGELFEDKDDQA